eukprot:3470445-Amphidinium_carterae.1
MNHSHPLISLLAHSRAASQPAFNTRQDPTPHSRWYSAEGGHPAYISPARQMKFHQKRVPAGVDTAQRSQCQSCLMDTNLYQPHALVTRAWPHSASLQLLEPHGVLPDASTRVTHTTHAKHAQYVANKVTDEKVKDVHTCTAGALNKAANESQAALLLPFSLLKGVDTVEHTVCTPHVSSSIEFVVGLCWIAAGARPYEPCPGQQNANLPSARLCVLHARSSPTRPFPLHPANSRKCAGLKEKYVYADKKILSSIRPHIMQCKECRQTPICITYSAKVRRLACATDELHHNIDDIGERCAEHQKCAP